MRASIPAGQFKASCLKLMDEVAVTGQAIVITKRGKPVARLMPVAALSGPIAGALAGSVEIIGDIIAPIGESWNESR
jgi:prevent-host-death family protein